MTGYEEWGQNECYRTDNCGKNAAERNNPTGEGGGGGGVMGYGLRVTGKCTNGCTMLLQSSDYPPTMVRLNSAQRNECINWHAAWLIAQSVATDKRKSKRKKNQKRKRKRKKILSTLNSK